MCLAPGLMVLFLPGDSRFPAQRLGGITLGGSRETLALRGRPGSQKTPFPGVAGVWKPTAGGPWLGSVSFTSPRSWDFTLYPPSRQHPPAALSGEACRCHVSRKEEGILDF